MKKFPVGMKNTNSGAVGGLSHPGYVVDTKSDMQEITPRKAQSNKLNYKKGMSGQQGRG